jgi:hypothetical protein
LECGSTTYIKQNNIPNDLKQGDTKQFYKQKKSHIKMTSVVHVMQSRGTRRRYGASKRCRINDHDRLTIVMLLTYLIIDRLFLLQVQCATSNSGEQHKTLKSSISLPIWIPILSTWPPEPSSSPTIAPDFYQSIDDDIETERNTSTLSFALFSCVIIAGSLALFFTFQRKQSRFPPKNEPEWYLEDSQSTALDSGNNSGEWTTSDKKNFRLRHNDLEHSNSMKITELGDDKSDLYKGDACIDSVDPLQSPEHIRDLWSIDLPLVCNIPRICNILSLWSGDESDDSSSSGASSSDSFDEIWNDIEEYTEDDCNNAEHQSSLSSNDNCIRESGPIDIDTGYYVEEYVTNSMNQTIQPSRLHKSVHVRRHTRSKSTFIHKHPRTVKKLREAYFEAKTRYNSLQPILEISHGDDDSVSISSIQSKSCRSNCNRTLTTSPHSMNVV